VKNSFSSPNPAADGTKANSQKSFEQVTLMQEESGTPSTNLRRTNTQQASRTELRLKKKKNSDANDKIVTTQA
jgi:hypothetical protein